MNFKRHYIVALSFFLLIAISDQVMAQCAMCKAVATSNIENNSNDVGKGLNDGILYLMTVPYIILGSIFFFAFKKQILAKISELKKPNTSDESRT